jgi:hypothetical protein
MMEHAKNYGRLTYLLEKKLQEKFENGEMDSNHYSLFVDLHRNPHLPGESAHILPHLSKIGSRSTGLSKCDIMIATNQPKKAVLLIEVEEGSRGTSPKTILGDVFNVWMADSIRCKGDSFGLDDTKLWVIVFEPKTGDKSEQYHGLQKNLDKLREPIQKNLHPYNQVTATEIVRVKVGQTSLIDTVLKKMKEELRGLFTTT